MRERMPTTTDGRDVRLERIPEMSGDNDDNPITIVQAWAAMQDRIGDGKWWSMGRDLSQGQIRKLHAGLINRAWYAGYTKEMLELRRARLDGVCFRWAWRAQDHPAIERNRAVRLAAHAKRVSARRQRKRGE